MRASAQRGLAPEVGDMSDAQSAAMAATLAVGIVAVVLAAASQMQSRAQRGLIDAWTAFARGRGFDLVAKSGPWYRRRGPTISGSVDGVPFVLAVERVHRGKHSVAFTRVRGELARPLRSKLVVDARNWTSKLRFLFSLPIVETGHSQFDATTMVRTRERNEALALLDADLRARIAAFPRKLGIECVDRAATISWRAAERDPHVLAAGCEMLAALCRPRR
jgi:hypothetical protein